MPGVWAPRNTKTGCGRTRGHDLHRRPLGRLGLDSLRQLVRPLLAGGADQEVLPVSPHVDALVGEP